MDMRKKVVVLGSGNSGSGAVLDYLALRPDFYSPVNQEFRLIQDPGGIMELHAALVFGFHVNRASSAIHNFIDLCNRCGRLKNKYQMGLSYNQKLTNYEFNVNKFVSAITTVEYNGMPFCEISKLSRWDTFFYRIRQEKAKKKGTKYVSGITRLPVDEETFLRETEKFLDAIFDCKHLDPMNKLSIVIDQGGSYWSPDSSTKYYGDNRKAIVVSRDPRGVFSSFQTKGQAYPGYSVEIFCEWYKKMMTHVNYDEWDSEKVMHIQFEEFVNNFEEEKIKLDNFLEVPSDIMSSIKIDKSSFNSKKFQDRLSEREMDVICKELKEFLYF